MSLSIRTNVASLNAQRNLTSNQLSLDTSLARLSSGFRITKAGDDAAGLGISSKLESQIRSYGQATRNANDGLSVIQASESALNEQGNILTRLRELAMQSASDGIGNTERGYVDKEAQALVSELERISQVTEYNGTKLLNGSNASGLDFHVGIQAGANDVINLKTVNATTAAAGAVAAAPPSTLRPAFLVTAANTYLTALTGNWADEGGARTTTGLLASPNAAAAVQAADALHEMVQGAVISAGFTLANLASSPGAQAAATSVITNLGINGDATAYPIFQAAISQFVSSINGGAAWDTAESDAVAAALPGAVTLVGAGASATQLSQNAGYTASALFRAAYAASAGSIPPTGVPVPPGAALDAGLAVLGASGGGGGGGGSGAASGGLGVAGLSLSTKASAKTALATIDSALSVLSSARADLGATGNRLQSAVNNIQAFSESLSAANSRIKDVDVAEETSRMARSQILAQAGVSVLAQANQMPQLALKLLG